MNRLGRLILFLSLPALGLLLASTPARAEEAPPADSQARERLRPAHRPGGGRRRLPDGRLLGLVPFGGEGRRRPVSHVRLTLAQAPAVSSRLDGGVRGGARHLEDRRGAVQVQRGGAAGARAAVLGRPVDPQPEDPAPGQDLGAVLHGVDPPVRRRRQARDPDAGFALRGHRARRTSASAWQPRPARSAPGPAGTPPCWPPSPAPSTAS